MRRLRGYGNLRLYSSPYRGPGAPQARSETPLGTVVARRLWRGWRCTHTSTFWEESVHPIYEIYRRCAVCMKKIDGTAGDKLLS